MYEFLGYITIFQIISDIFDMCIGSALIFGALKWRKGLLTTTAFYWGIVLGCLSGLFITFLLDADIGVVIITIIIGAVIFPILTYCFFGGKPGCANDCKIYKSNYFWDNT